MNLLPGYSLGHNSGPFHLAFSTVMKGIVRPGSSPTVQGLTSQPHSSQVGWGSLSAHCCFQRLPPISMSIYIGQLSGHLFLKSPGLLAKQPLGCKCRHVPLAIYHFSMCGWQSYRNSCICLLSSSILTETRFCLHTTSSYCSHPRPSLLLSLFLGDVNSLPLT